jgi:rubredoxin
MDPVTDVTFTMNVANLAKKLYEIAKSLKDREIKQRVDDVIDELRDLKQRASDLEDENRNLAEQLRFKAGEFDFNNPFWYEKAYPDRPLCPKCFADKKIAPMSEPRGENGSYRRCLVCGFHFDTAPRSRSNPGPYGRLGGPDSWMVR